MSTSGAIVVVGTIEEYSKVKGQEFEIIKLASAQRYEMPMEYWEIGYDDIPVWAFDDDVIDDLLAENCVAIVNAHKEEDYIYGMPVRVVNVRRN